MKGMFGGLPKWAQGVIAVAVLGGVGILGYVLYKKIQDLGENKQNREDLSDIRKTIRDLSKKGINTKLSEGQLASMSGSLKQAFDGCGTKNGVVTEVFNQMTNEADVYSLIEKYGTRKYDGCNFEFDLSDKEFTLPDALSSEGNTSSVNAQLKSKNINFQF